MDIQEGGTNIPYWMEDPSSPGKYAEMLHRNSAENRMNPLFYEKSFKGELPKE